MAERIINTILNSVSASHDLNYFDIISMPTLTQLIQTPEAFTLESVINQNPQYLQRFIDYITIPQNMLLSNERQCYLYPSKISDILSSGMAYRLLIQKKVYIYLQKLFNNINKEQGQPTLLGYCCKVLISLVKKTPQIYEFIKDNQNLLLQILQDENKMDSLKEFLSLFLTQSTMDLYVFLKSMLIRNIIFRIVQDENVGPSVYKSIDYFYQHILKCFEDVAEDEKIQLEEVCKNFEDQHFLTLLILKIDTTNSSRNLHIANFLYRVITHSIEGCELISHHVDTILDFLEEYEESSDFMERIRPEHLSILRLIIQLMKLGKLNEEIVAQLIKRLLVYSNVHSKNTVIHNLLMRAITYCREQGKEQLLNHLNIISFFVKSETQQHYGFMSLRRRIFSYWVEHKLDQQLDEGERLIINQLHNQRKQIIGKSIYYKEFHVNSNNSDFSSTKNPTDLSQMTIK